MGKYKYNIGEYDSTDNYLEYLRKWGDLQESNNPDGLFHVIYQAAHHQSYYWIEDIKLEELEDMEDKIPESCNLTRVYMNKTEMRKDLEELKTEERK